jgi:AraC-like DNA-binding protein
MSVAQVLLILISGLGVLHGLLLAIFLWIYPKGLRSSNRILSLLLLVLSFRIGKSVILEFASGIHLQLIFLGLAMLLLIGPLYYFYVRSVLEKVFRITRYSLLHFVPAAIAAILSLWLNKDNVNSTPTVIFAVLFCFYYGHYLVYLFISRKLLARKQAEGNSPAVRWLNLLLYALAALWVVYVLNLLEDSIPYVLGPVLYSIIAYGVSFIAFRSGYIAQLDQTKYKTTPLSETELDQLFGQIKQLVAVEGLYKDPDLTLSSLSKRLRTSPQKISMAVNSRHGDNFNGFVNQLRVKKAQLLMKESVFRDYTIAAIAFEVGFNSLTSFNTAFKKETQKTPSAYRKETAQL